MPSAGSPAHAPDPAGREEPTFMLKANAICNQMGLDVDAAGGPIGWAMECYQRGILTEKDTDGLKLQLGRRRRCPRAHPQNLHPGGFRQHPRRRLRPGCGPRGPGQYLLRPAHQGAGPLRALPRRPGVVSGHDHSHAGRRPHNGSRPGPTSCPCGKEKVRSIFGVRNPWPQEYEDKAKMVTYMEALHRVNNCLGICHFNTIHGDWDQIDLPHLADLYSAATGWDVSWRICGGWR